MSAQFTRAHQRQIDNMDEPQFGDAPTESEIAEWLIAADVHESLLEAMAYACRTKDFGYMTRQFDRLAMPVIERERQS